MSRFSLIALGALTVACGGPPRVVAAPATSAESESAESAASRWEKETPITYDADSHDLALVNVELSDLRAYVYLALTRREAPRDGVGPFTEDAALGSVGLSGAEYWPFAEDASPNYRRTFSGASTRSKA